MDAFDEHDHVHDQGLAFDLATLLDRRRAIALMGGLGLAKSADIVAFAFDGEDRDVPDGARTENQAIRRPARTPSWRRAAIAIP